MYQKANKELSILSLYLGDYSKKLYLREISKFSKLPLRTAQRTLADLENARILKSEIRGKNKYLFLNIENIETKHMLLQAETYKTLQFLEKYPAFKSFLKETKGVSVPIIVFGSFAKFTADKTSDVDMLIISDKKVEIPSYLLPNELHEMYMSKDNFIRASEKNEVLIKKIEENHVILNNHSFFVDFMWDKYGR
ncbi:Nucleotidyltransferase domain protein [uncultured archaeon]|nr:Nucleotidyltransferase domain protein [uncultured archaeon]